MRKELLAVVLAALAGVIGLTLFMRARPAEPARVSPGVSATKAVRPPVKSSIRVAPQPAAADSGESSDIKAPSTDDRQSPVSSTPVSLEKPGPVLSTIPRDEAPLARVNGVDLTASKIFPPGVMRSGDKLPKLALDKFLEDAVNKAVVVQEAEKRGYGKSPEFLKLMDDLNRDIAEMPNLSPEERAWQLNELRDMALMDRVYREEGIIPRRITADEVESYYQAHSADYDWVRKREALKNSSPEKAELRVRNEIRKDLQIPIMRQLTQERDEVTHALLKQADVELLSDAGTDNPD